MLEAVRDSANTSPLMLPDVRDGLTGLERIVLVVLAEAEREFPGRSVPTALLFGRVVEQIQVGPAEFQRVLTRLTGSRAAHGV